MKRLFIAATLLSLVVITAWGWQQFALPDSGDWSEDELRLLSSLSLSQLPELPPDLSNAVADSKAAARLGHKLYFDPRLSGNGEIACASCHQPDRYFTDGRPLAVGTAVGSRHTPSLVGLSHSPWFYWDGRKDSQWAQALAPLEAAHEHNLDRLNLVRVLQQDPDYQADYAGLFGPLPQLAELPDRASPLGDPQAQANWSRLDEQQQQEINRAFSNIGKSLAAYQRLLMPGRSRFDDYIDAVTQGQDSGALSSAEIAGLRLFIGKAQCVSCHNGPLLTNHDFHNTGVRALPGTLPPMGRFDGIRLARKDPFNCQGRYSDAQENDCLELRYAQDSNEMVGAHKTPTLRNVAETAPYMHTGQIATLIDVMRHYNEAPVSMLSHNEAKPLKLRPGQLRQLEALMLSLTAPLAVEPFWLVAPQGNP
jgi:cytochrome c peroxidase